MATKAPKRKQPKSAESKAADPIHEANLTLFLTKEEMHSLEEEARRKLISFSDLVRQKLFLPAEAK